MLTVHVLSSSLLQIAYQLKCSLSPRLSLSIVALDPQRCLKMLQFDLNLRLQNTNLSEMRCSAVWKPLLREAFIDRHLPFLQKQKHISNMQSLETCSLVLKMFCSFFCYFIFCFVRRSTLHPWSIGNYFTRRWLKWDEARSVKFVTGNCSWILFHSSFKIINLHVTII